MRFCYHYLIGGLWLLWAVGWTVSALGTKRAVRAEGLSARLSHLPLLLLVAGLFVFPHAWGRWLAEGIYTQTIYTFWTGAALVLLGLGSAVWARVRLAGNWSGTVTLKQDHSLTRSGPCYCFTTQTTTPNATPSVTNAHTGCTSLGAAASGGISFFPVTIGRTRFCRFITA